MASGTIIGSQSLDWKLKIDWSYTQSVEQNTTTITSTLSYYKPWESRVWNLAMYSAYYEIQGEKTYDTFDVTGRGWFTLGSKTWTISHNTDGTYGNLSLTGHWCTDITSSATVPTNLYVSDTISIPTIPRKSSVSATDAYIGSSCVITISAASSAFTHTLTYNFGTLSGTIATKTADKSIAFQFPETFYGQIPNDRTGAGLITCETFSGDTSLGTTTCKFNALTSAEICAPTVSGTVIDTNSKTTNITGNPNVLVKYFSTAVATIDASANKSSTIKATEINGVAGSTRTFDNCEINAFTFTAVDSREYSNSYSLELTMVSYIKLTNNATASRVTPTGDEIAIAFGGNYFDNTFGSKNNTLTCKYRTRQKNGSWGAYTQVTASVTNNSYTYSTTVSGFDYKNAYDIEFVVEDELMTVSRVVSVSQGIPIIDWGEKDVSVNGDLTVRGSLNAPVAYTADESTSYTSDENTKGCTPAAVKKAVGLFPPASHTHSEYAVKQAYNDMLTIGPNGWKEFTFASPACDGVVLFNYRTASGSTDGTISAYGFCGGNTRFVPVQAQKYYNQYDLVLGSEVVLLNWTGIGDNGSVSFTGSTYSFFVVYAYITDTFMTAVVTASMMGQTIATEYNGTYYPFTLTKSGNTYTLTRKGTATVNYHVIAIC